MQHARFPLVFSACRQRLDHPEQTFHPGERAFRHPAGRIEIRRQLEETQMRVRLVRAVVAFGQTIAPAGSVTG